MISAIERAYHSPAFRVEDHIGHSRQLLQAFPTRLLDLDTDFRVWILET